MNKKFINVPHREVMLNMSLPWVTFARSPNHFIKIPVVIAVITEIWYIFCNCSIFSLELVSRCGKNIMGSIYSTVAYKNFEKYHKTTSVHVLLHNGVFCNGCITKRIYFL
jgi:hypothetical protein